jgi:hypothetical protein
VGSAGPHRPAQPQNQKNKSLFASFSSEKEDSFLPTQRAPPASRIDGLLLKQKEDSSFSEEKEAKRLLFLVLWAPLPCPLGQREGQGGNSRVRVPAE